MAKEELNDMSAEQLNAKSKGIKVFIGISIALIIGLFYFIFLDYYSGYGIDWAILTIAICTLAVPATLYPELQEIKKELKTRR